jgi:hypothetical protein
MLWLFPIVVPLTNIQILLADVFFIFKEIPKHVGKRKPNIEVNIIFLFYFIFEFIAGLSLF